MKYSTLFYVQRLGQNNSSGIPGLHTVHVPLERTWGYSILISREKLISENDFSYAQPHDASVSYTMTTTVQQQCSV